MPPARVKLLPAATVTSSAIVMLVAFAPPIVSVPVLAVSRLLACRLVAVPVPAMLKLAVCGEVPFWINPSAVRPPSCAELIANGTDVIRFIGVISPSGLQEAKVLQLGELPAIFILRYKVSSFQFTKLAKAVLEPRFTEK